MKSKNSTIHCPDCNTPIAIEITQLLQGSKFSCSTCKASVGLSMESKNILEKAVKSYERSNF
ncbi:MAG: hypothetical protein LBI72_12695 [Flavobacteriaceae bacterium]|jgi:DNA-directed RNA polymerase subunit RPC12/RpoP|nr:hypothetical protein [Flavobacteriaceae bacterium]